MKVDQFKLFQQKPTKNCVIALFVFKTWGLENTKKILVHVKQ